jgi:hypothetical protein
LQRGKMMPRNQLKFLFILGVGMLVVSGIGLTPAFIESATGLNTYNHQIQPDDHAPRIMETVLQCPAETGNYLEDFTTTTYQDSTNTNVSGWGNGNLHLPRKNPTLAGTYNTPGIAHGIYVSGDYAYVADDNSGLQVINVTNPSQPSLAGSYNTPGFAQGVFVNGNYVYVADALLGLQVINITNPSQPSLAGTCNTPGWAFGVFVSGDYAYVADYESGLQVINITNPSQPSLVGTYNTPGGAYGVFVSGDYAYLADYESGLQVINITNPSQPSLVGSYNTPGGAYGVFVSGDYAYVADGSSGLQVINITNLSQPSLVGSYNTPGDAWGVFVYGNYAYVADGSSGLEMINITNPSQPSLAGSYNTPAFARGVFMSGDYAYVADYHSGLQVIQIADYTTPSYVGSYNTADYAQGVFVSGDYAYVADALSGLQVINITNPSQPSLAGSCNTPGDAFGMFVNGDYAYIADGSFGLSVINITNPTQPSLAGSYNTIGYSQSVFVSGDYAYVTDGASGLQVINITDPSQPSLAGSYNTIGYSRSVFVSGDYAYVADGASGLQVVNITNPSQPSLASSCNTPGDAYGVFVSGNYAYVADGASGLQVINITNPSQPSLASSCNTPGDARGVFVSGDYTYVADSYSGLQVINITHPSQPSLAGTYNTPDYARGVFVSGDYAYVADGASGLQVVEVMWSRCRQFEPLAVAQSLPVFEPMSVFAVSATLSVQQSIPPNTMVDYYLSADNGSHWESVIPDSECIFMYPRKQLMWKVVLATSHALVTPDISSLAITYVSLLDAPILLAPDDGALINDNTPTFEWEMVSGAVSYLLQLDTVSSFDSVNLINTTVVSLTYTPSSELVDGIWFWRVAAKDIGGDLGAFSSTRSLDIETGLPVWVQVPTSQVCEFGLSFRYDLNASDPSGLDQWWINDTAHFAIDGTGVITNTTISSVNYYGLQVWVNDTYNNILTGVFTVFVQDTQPPTWVTAPTDQTLEYGVLLDYQLAASDLSGLETWWLNNTVNFNIGSNGRITSIGVLTPGVFGVQIFVNDTYNNVLMGTFTVIVEDTTSPTWVQTPTSQALEFGDIFFYDVDAFDLSGIDHGGISNATTLAMGIYWLEVRAYDHYGLHCSATFAVTIQEPTYIPTEVPLWMILVIAALALIGGIAIVGIGAYVISRRRRKSP